MIARGRLWSGRSRRVIIDEMIVLYVADYIIEGGLYRMFPYEDSIPIKFSIWKERQVRMRNP